MFRMREMKGNMGKGTDFSVLYCDHVTKSDMRAGFDLEKSARSAFSWTTDLHHFLLEKPIF